MNARQPDDSTKRRVLTGSPVVDAKVWTCVVCSGSDGTREQLCRMACNDALLGGRNDINGHSARLLADATSQL